MSKKLIYSAIILLAILHQDFWWWHDATLLFDFLPIGLAYHMGISIAASILWALAVFFAWPEHLEDALEEEESAS